MMQRIMQILVVIHCGCYFSYSPSLAMEINHYYYDNRWIEMHHAHYRYKMSSQAKALQCSRLTANNNATSLINQV